jgi:hypothetical protein
MLLLTVKVTGKTVYLNTRCRTYYGFADNKSRLLKLRQLLSIITNCNGKPQYCLNANPRKIRTVAPAIQKMSIATIRTGEELMLQES